jgi:hypothetical protein
MEKIKRRLIIKIKKPQSHPNSDDIITTMQNSEKRHKETENIRPLNCDFNTQPFK